MSYSKIDRIFSRNEKLFHIKKYFIKIGIELVI